MTQRLVQRPAGVPFVLLRPEESQECIPPVETTGPADSEIDKESDALGLGEDRLQGLASGELQGERSESAELNHVAEKTLGWQ
jgi:hypothetical protein